MARIRPYESQLSPQGGIPSRDANVRDVAPNYAPLGQAIESGGYAAGHAQALLQDQASRAAVTDVHTMLSGAQSAYTRRLAELETKANPADNNLHEQFFYGEGDENEPSEGSFKWYLDSYKEQITDPSARAAFEIGAASMATNFTSQLVHVQARMAGVHAQQQARAMVNNAKTTVQTDPSLYSAVLNQTLTAINDPKTDFGRLSAERREPIIQMATEELGESTMRGMIRDHPQQALRQLENNSHGLQLAGKDLPNLLKSADTAIFAQGAEARRVEAEALRQKKALYDATDQSLGAKYAAHEGNPGNSKLPPVTATEIGHLMADDRLDGPTGRAWLNMIESNSKERTLKNDESTSAELFRRIKLPYGDPDKLTDLNKVTDAASKRKLTPARYNFLRAEFVKSQTDEGASLGPIASKVIDSFKPSITTSNPAQAKLDNEGDILFGQFQVFASQEEERLRKVNEDPRTLYQRESKNYIGNHVPQFQRTMGETITTIGKMLNRKPGITAPGGGVPPEKHRLQGETPEQYLDRMNKK